MILGLHISLLLYLHYLYSLQHTNAAGGSFLPRRHDSKGSLTIRQRLSICGVGRKARAWAERDVTHQQKSGSSGGATGSCPVTVGRDLAGTQRLVAAETFHLCAVRAGHHLSWNQGERIAHMNW